MTRTRLTIVSFAIAIGLSGCVTSISSRGVQEAPQSYQPIPQGIEPPPMIEPAPEPYVPASPQTSQDPGVRTTSFMQSLGDRLRGSFAR